MGVGRSPVLRWHFPSSAAAVGRMRQELDTALSRLDASGDSHDAVLLVANELAANAVEHGDGEVDVRATFSDGSVRIAVSDASPDPPRIRPPSLSALRGRGLRVIDGLATRWSWSADSTGKTVWAEVPTDGGLGGR
ncbi:ATP-binding protein [Pseudonocardia sp. MH-G8]|uniref:ATP-binding protein n=1 Tax=Pseudonocardia sp. MH-G8 TaxID=1854588 RepID=UPI00117ABC25|nr:ATP-binding protein [Pseudonocardia sp. MH-G8]